MSRRALLAAAALAIALPGVARAERVVDYAIDEATAARDAVEQGVALAPLPARGPLHVALVLAPEVDHRVLRVGIACSAWTVQNPMSMLLARMFAAWDRDGAPQTGMDGDAALLVTVARAATLSRCVGTGELKSQCITRVSIDGSVARAAAPPRPFHVETEAATKGIGACAGLTRGIGLVSRAAVAKLIGELGQALAATR